MKSTIHVHLAEVPTDVLLHLAAHSTRVFTVHDLALVLAPEPCPDADQAVGRALALLREGGYVYRNGGYQWGVTSAGMAAVSDAKQSAVTGGSTETADKQSDDPAHSLPEPTGGAE